MRFIALVANLLSLLSGCSSVCTPEQDADGDGWYDETAYCRLPDDGFGFEPDYADDDPTVYPGAEELCDDKDNNIDDALSLAEVDADQDGYMVCEGDCDDQDIYVRPNADDDGDENVDKNCDGIPGDDNDGDGYASQDTNGDDCDDEDAAINPEVDEQDHPDEYGVDHNCDPGDDYDHDRDGYAAWFVENGTDCVDDDAAINPGAIEVYYDGVDQNCDGASDFDRDEDGHDSADYDGDDCDDFDPEVWNTC